MGQKFSTSLRENAQLADDYNRLKGPGSAALKRDFRIKWAKMTMDNLVLFRKRKVDELFEEFGEEGKYMAFDKLCIAEGGLDNPLAIQRAINYTNACIKQGHPFVVWDSWKQCTEFCYFEKTRKNVFTRRNAIERESQMQATEAQLSNDTHVAAVGGQDTAENRQDLPHQTSSHP